MDLTTGDRRPATGDRLFDVYLAVDWSARSLPSPARPTADALWVGEALAAAPHDSQESYWRTRAACVAYVRARLVAHVRAGRRVLIGCDFPYGYPVGTAAALSGGTAPSYAAAALSGDAAPSYDTGDAAWRWMWDWLVARIADDAANGNNRFAVAAAANACAGGSPPGPFWGCPPAQAGPHLTPTSPPYPYATAAGPVLARLRAVERRLRGTQPCWKLLGTGSVGGQALVGIPRVAAWRADPALAAVSRVWPFETGFTALPTIGRGPAIIHAEIWPGVVPDPLDPTVPIRDQAQVRAVVRWLAAHDAVGTLGRLFDLPPDLTPAATAACLAEEGWLLGA